MPMRIVQLGLTSTFRMIRDAAASMQSLVQSGKSPMEAWNGSTVMLTWAAIVSLMIGCILYTGKYSHFCPFVALCPPPPPSSSMGKFYFKINQNTTVSGRIPVLENTQDYENNCYCSILII